MMNALYSAATGMSAQQTGMDVIAHNLANVNTTGFKETRLSFEDLLYQQVGDRQASRMGSQVGMGVAPGRTELNFQQGDLQETGNATDLAIEGNGFFQVQLPNDQIGYTRAGNFAVDANGQLTTNSGYRLEPAVVIPETVEPGSVQISSTGRVTGKVENQLTVLGQIDIASFKNPQGLQAMGDNVYLATVNSGPPSADTPGTVDRGYIRQGFLEGSNVKVMEQMVDMITSQRAFESVSKVISTSDEMLGMANSMRR